MLNLNFFFNLGLLEQRTAHSYKSLFLSTSHSRDGSLHNKYPMNPRIAENKTILYTLYINITSNVYIQTLYIMKQMNVTMEIAENCQLLIKSYTCESISTARLKNHVITRERQFNVDFYSH